jgi:hypothetical protein
MQNEKGYNLAGRSVFIALPAYDFKVSLKLAISLAQCTDVLYPMIVPAQKEAA